MKNYLQLLVFRCQFLKCIFFVSLLTICHLSVINSLFAEEKIRIEEVVVTASRVEEPVEQTISDVRVIKGEDIKKMNVEFVTDVLRKIPELNLVQNGGTGKVATVILRGGNSSSTLVMIDGIKVNSTATGSFDFSGINVDDIKRIEIVKGPQSTIYGSEAIAGVINNITKKGEGRARIDTSLESGSFGTFKPSVTVSGGDKKLDYRLTGSYFYTDGISAAEQGSEKDGYKNASISGKFGFRPSENLELELIGKYYYDRSELDDFDFFSKKAVDNLNFVQHGTHYLLSGKAKFFLSNLWEQIVTLSTVSDSLKFRDPVITFNNADIITSRDTIEWQHNFYLSDIYTLTAGAEYRKEKGENKGNFDRSTDNKAIYLNNKLMLFKEDLVLNAGIRYDDYETFGCKTTYRIGALYNFRQMALRIKSSYGTGFRAPKFNELFFPFYGNPDLKPEESNAWEIGIEKDFFEKRMTISLTYFDQKYKNLIQTDPLTFTASNIARAKVKGVEVNAAVKMTDNITMKAGYTYLDTKDEDTGQRLHLRPKDKVNISAEFYTKDLSVVANYTFVSKRFDSSAARNLSSYSLVNLAGNYKVTKWLTLFARIDNLFDARYEEVGSFGTPGFSVFGGIKITSL